MDKISNPFSPGAGSPPPELAGRNDIIEQADVLLGRVLLKRSEKSLLLTGLRGVGKTVLLKEIEVRAKKRGYRTIFIEAIEKKGLAELLAPKLCQLLYDLDRVKGLGDKVKRGLGVLKSFLKSIKFTYQEIEIGLDIDAEKGSADSGDIEIDLPVLFTAVAEAAQEHQCAVAIMIDELQYFSEVELSALIMAMHQMQQNQLPLVLIGAGLSVLPQLVGESKSYAERLFSFPEVGPLSESDVYKALQDPVKAAGVEFDESALRKIFELSRGYPYFIQEWGYMAWNQAEHSPITLQIIIDATPTVISRLDKNFFRVRFDRLTPSEKNFLRVMASMDCEPYRTSDIANLLGKPITRLGPIRSKLIKKGIIYSPVYGYMSYTVPLFSEFMRRVMPDFQVKPQNEP